MAWRLAVLAVLILIRLVFNLVIVGRYRLGETVRLRLDAYKIERLASGCIIKEGVFWLKDRRACDLESGSAVLISGNLRASLTDRLLGRVWLEQSSDYTIAEAGKAKKSFLTVLSAKVANFRAELVRKTLGQLPSPEGELALGIVMGYKTSLPRAFYEQLVASGTVHIVVASGYNVMVVAGMALTVMLLFFRRRRATLMAVGWVWLYVVLAGGEISLLRAALMGSLALIALAWGRGGQLWWSLSLAIAWFLFMSPPLLENISFQLSVAATIGVALIGPFLARLWGRSDPLELSTTAGALVATAPFIWWHFGRLSLISLISNGFVLPLVPALMFLSALTMILALAFPLLATVVSWPTYALAHLMVVLIGLFGRG